MPEHEREARQVALLTDYERILVADLAATPPPGLDPALATVARLLAQELGGPRPDRAVKPDLAFKSALRQRLAEQAAAQARPAAPTASAVTALPVARPTPAVQRDRHGRPLLPTPVIAPSVNGKEPRLRTAVSRSAAPEVAPAPTRLRPVRAAVATGAGWLGAALVILIVILAATLLLRGLPQSTPAVQPNATPSPSVAPTAPAITPTVNGATPRPAGPSWRSAATMGTPRINHTATLLADGRVLVTGGRRTPAQGDRDLLASVEIYDPATDRWNPAAPLETPRWGHTATLLKDGRVLVAGGDREGPEDGSLNSVEIYDPRADRWSVATPMNQDRTDHTAILLADGRLLVAGGNDNRVPSEITAEVYDPLADRWTMTEGFINTGNGQITTLLQDGSVLATGGAPWVSTGGSPTLRFDPSTNTWQAVAALTPGRFGHGAAVLPNGQVLIAGGQEKQQSSSAPYPAPVVTLRYDPVADRWNPAAPLANSRLNPVLVTLASGQVLAIGGVGSSNSQDFPAALERYDPVADRWVTVGQLPSMRFGHTATRLTDGRVLVAGGYSGGEFATANAELYTDGPVAPVASATPAATPSTAALLWQATGAMAAPHARHSATRLADGRVLVAGGYNAGGEGTAEAEIYDPKVGRWSPTGAMNVARYGHRAILLADGQILVVGGMNYRQFSSMTTDGAERYDPATGRWALTGPLPLGFTPTDLVLLNDGRVLTVSNPDATAGNKTTATVYDPATDQWAVIGNPDLPNVTAAITLRDGTVLIFGEVGQENDGTTPVVRYDPASGEWSVAAPLPDARGSFTADLLPDGRVLVAGGISFRQGADGVDTTTFHDTTFLFDPATGQWSAAATMGTARTNHTATVLSDGRVLIVGGDDPTRGTRPATAELYDPQTGRWSTVGGVTSNARAYFAVTPLADGRAIVTGGDAGFARSEFLANVDLFTPPARGASPATPQATPTPAVRPATPTPTTSAGSIDWNSQQSGLLLYGGRGYRLRELTQPNGTGPSVGQQVGTTTLRLQSGGVFPAGTTIYAVAGRASEEWVALKDGDRVYAYQRDDTATALLQGFQVVIGTVEDAGTTVCPPYGCPKSPDQQQAGTIATVQRVTIERNLQGNLAPGQSIEVRQMGTADTAQRGGRFVGLQPGDRVVLFLTPAQQESVGDFAAGDYFWTAPGWISRVSGQELTPADGFPRDPPLPLAIFEAAVADLFRDVTPLAPTAPRPTPRPIPTATGIVARPTASLPAPVATPTPTPGS